jgi:hypothetical protein
MLIRVIFSTRSICLKDSLAHRLFDCLKRNQRWQLVVILNLKEIKERCSHFTENIVIHEGRNKNLEAHDVE